MVYLYTVTKSSNSYSRLVFTFTFLLTVVPVKKKKLGKNPDVDTSFLPDREREVLLMISCTVFQYHPFLKKGLYLTVKGIASLTS